MKLILLLLSLVLDSTLTQAEKQVQVQLKRAQVELIKNKLMVKNIVVPHALLPELDPSIDLWHQLLAEMHKGSRFPAPDSEFWYEFNRSHAVQLFIPTFKYHHLVGSIYDWRYECEIRPRKTAAFDNNLGLSIDVMSIVEKEGHTTIMSILPQDLTIYQKTDVEDVKFTGFEVGACVQSERDAAFSIQLVHREVQPMLTTQGVVFVLNNVVEASQIHRHSIPTNGDTFLYVARQLNRGSQKPLPERQWYLKFKRMEKLQITVPYETYRGFTSNIPEQQYSCTVQIPRESSKHTYSIEMMAVYHKDTFLMNVIPPRPPIHVNSKSRARRVQIGRISEACVLMDARTKR